MENMVLDLERLEVESFATSSELVAECPSTAGPVTEGYSCGDICV